MEDLIGKMVLVHPELTVDPVNNQGRIGMITGADLAKDNINVAFGSRPAGLYGTDALLVLKPHNELYRDLLTHVKDLDIQDFKALLRISMLQDRGTSGQVKEALEIAMTTSKVLDFSTVSLENSLGLDRMQYQQASQSYGARR